MEKLQGRDMINSHAIAKKLNEVIDLLEEKKITESEDSAEKELIKSENG